jgi:hypothetical protein
MRVRTVAAIFAAVLVAAGTAGGPAFGAELGDEARISAIDAVARSFEGPAAAVDPNDDDHIFVAASDLLSNSCHVYRSTNRGRTFTELEGPDFGTSTDCGLNKGGIPQNMRMKRVSCTGPSPLLIPPTAGRGASCWRVRPTTAPPGRRRP